MKSLILIVSFLTSSMALACPSGNLCKGDRIVDSSNNVGFVLDVFSNGKAQVSLDRYYGTFIRNVSDLGKGVRCNQHICEGDRIVDSSNHVGKAVEVFDNGKSKVSLDSDFGYFIRSINDLGKGYRCIENLCEGDRIIDSSNNMGKAVEIFDNGKVKVSLDSDFGYFIRSFQSLGIELNCRLRDNCSCRN
jgi:hypothetical protein